MDEIRYGLVGTSESGLKKRKELAVNQTWNIFQIEIVALGFDPKYILLVSTPIKIRKILFSDTYHVTLFFHIISSRGDAFVTSFDFWDTMCYQCITLVELKKVTVHLSCEYSWIYQKNMVSFVASIGSQSLHQLFWKVT